MDDNWIASPLGRSRLIAAAVILICLVAMFAITGFGSGLAGIF